MRDLGDRVRGRTNGGWVSIGSTALGVIAFGVWAHFEYLHFTDQPGAACPFGEAHVNVGQPGLVAIAGAGGAAVLYPWLRRRPHRWLVTGAQSATVLVVVLVADWWIFVSLAAGLRCFD